MTHRALEPWHMLIDPVMGESSRSLLVVCHREWLHAHSLTRGVGARNTRLRLNGCQVMCTLWKSVHWGVHAFRTKKHYHRDLGNVMMSLVDLDVSRHQSETQKEVVWMNYLPSWRMLSWDDIANFHLFSAITAFGAQLPQQVFFILEAL